MELNKIHCMDCLEGMKQMEDNSVDLIVTDPPYNINKDTWDKIEGYYEWCISWVKECQRILKDNGSIYVFHNDMGFIPRFMVGIEQNTDFIFKQFIVWNKKFKGSKNEGFLQGFVEPEDLRNYQKMVEYILYYTFQDETGLSKIQGNCVYPIMEYIRSEIEKARGKIILKEINQVLGTATNGGGVASATLSLDKTVPAMMTKEHYLMLREWLNSGKEYKYLRKEYEDLRKEYEDLRYTFNNQKTHHSVWEYEIEKKRGHITPKPIELIKNILEHSSNKGMLVCDPFMGSGTTAVACKQLERNFIGFEKSQEYVNIANKRLEQGNLNAWFA